MPTKRVYYVDEFRSWHPYNSKSKHQQQQNTTGGAIACIEMVNPGKRRKVDDYEHTDTVESGVTSSFDESREEAAEEGGESVEQESRSWKIVRTMDYANDEDNDDGCDDNQYYIDSSVGDEVCKHDEIFTKHHIDHDDDGTGKNDNDKLVKTFQSKRKLCKTFDDRFKELEAFKRKNGHCNVPGTKKNNTEYYSLGVWCAKLRQIYKGNRLDGSKLSPSNIEALKDIGFRLTTQCTTSRSQKSFEERLKELEAFKTKNGHCNVPYTSKKNAEYYSLCTWCNKLRQIYKGNRLDGRKLSPSKIEALKDIGFQLDTVSNMKSFDDWLEELVAFKNENGHCNVPRSSNKHDEYNKSNGLGAWCVTIRASYRRMMRGDKPRRKLTDDNIQDLKKIGFCFSVSGLT